MIDPEPGHDAVAHQPEDEAVGLLEDRGHLHANGGQLVDVEEPPVVDLLAGHAPVRHAIGLLAEQPVEQVEGGRIAGVPR